MSRYKITVQYDGRDLQGWQLQKTGRTVQGELERALAVLNRGNRVAVSGAGRTDSGVHALGQASHFDLETRLSANKLVKAINGNISPDIRVVECQTVADDFHARFSATARSYRYQCRIDNDILARHYYWQIAPPDFDLLQQLAGDIMGRHDFSSYSKHNPALDNYYCDIHQSLWKKDDSVLIYYITANRFLHHMVRYLVGTMEAVAGGRFTRTDFLKQLNQPGPGKKLFRAPSQGLILTRVKY